MLKFAANLRAAAAAVHAELGQPSAGVPAADDLVEARDAARLQRELPRAADGRAARLLPPPHRQRREPLPEPVQPGAVEARSARLATGRRPAPDADPPEPGHHGQFQRVEQLQLLQPERGLRLLHVPAIQQGRLPTGPDENAR